jgi:hypothetical protein
LEGLLAVCGSREEKQKTSLQKNNNANKQKNK